MKKRDFALKTALKSGLRLDRLVFNSLQNKVVQELRKAKAQFFINIINEAKGNSKMIWKTINQLTKKDLKPSDRKALELDICGKLTNEPDEISAAFNNYFIDSVQNLAHSFGTRTKEISVPNPVYPVFNIMEVSEQKTHTFLSTLKNSKAKDIYGWDSSFLKSNKEALVAALTHLANLSVNQSTFPNAWKSSVVTPIYKAGEPTDVASYRPIEFVSLCSDNIRRTRASTRGNCVVQYRSTEFGRSAFSIRAANFWNTIPSNIRQCSTLSSFKSQLK